MKRVLKIIIYLLFVSTINVSAASFGMTLSTRTTSVKVGEEVNVAISLNNISGIPNGLNVCQATLSSSGVVISGVTGNGWNITNGKVLIMDSDSSVTSSATIANIKAKVNSAGSITISNIMCSDGENEYTASNKSISFSIKQETTTKKVINSTTTTRKITTTTKRITNNNTTTRPTTTTTTSIIEKNSTYLKYLSIENYQINFDKEILDYSLTVDNNVEKLNINYELEDPSSKVTINNNESLVVGNNKIEIIVSNNNAETTTYILNVKKEEASTSIKFNEEDILKALEQNTNNIDIKVDNNLNKIISSKIINKLKETKKIINFVVYENDKKIYSFKIDGNKLKEEKEIDFNIELNGNYKSNINELINNKDNILLNFKSNNILPSGTKITLYTTNLKDIAYLYYYNTNKNELEYIEEYKVENNEIILEINNGANYVLLNNRIDGIANILIPLIIITILLVTLIILIIYFKKQKLQKKTLDIETLTTE